MMIVQRYILVLAILVITGCSSLKLYFQDGLTYVDELVKSEDYESALHQVDQQDKKSPNDQLLQQQRPLIPEEIKRYEQRTLAQSKKLIKAQKWSDSIELLEKAIDHIPESKKLARELKRQKSTRDEEVSQLRYQITIQKAHSIKRENELYQYLYKLDSSTSITPVIILERSETIVQELMNWATTYVNDKETIKARNTLKLAGEITLEIRRSSEFRGLLLRIEEIEKGIFKAMNRNREIALEKQVREFNHLFEQDKLIEAQIALREIEKRFGKTETETEAIGKLRQKLDHTVSREIEAHMSNGKGFYSKEQIEYAINEWGHVLLLDPDNQEALENISRALKVLEQLQRVRRNKKNQGSVSTFD